MQSTFSSGLSAGLDTWSSLPIVVSLGSFARIAGRDLIVEHGGQVSLARIVERLIVVLDPVELRVEIVARGIDAVLPQERELGRVGRSAAAAAARAPSVGGSP